MNCVILDLNRALMRMDHNAEVITAKRISKRYLRFQDWPLNNSDYWTNVNFWRLR